jgi:hypothetical protein
MRQRMTLAAGIAYQLPYMFLYTVALMMLMLGAV